MLRKEIAQLLTDHFMREVGLRSVPGTAAELVTPSLVLQNTTERMGQRRGVFLRHYQTARKLSFH
jgi:hypothetical protein